MNQKKSSIEPKPQTTKKQPLKMDAVQNEEPKIKKVNDKYFNRLFY